MATVRTGPDEPRWLRSDSCSVSASRPTFRLKLAIAARILPLLASDTVYLDVSVRTVRLAGQVSSLR